MKLNSETKHKDTFKTRRAKMKSLIRNVYLCFLQSNRQRQIKD